MKYAHELSFVEAYCLLALFPMDCISAWFCFVYVASLNSEAFPTYAAGAAAI